MKINRVNTVDKFSTFLLITDSQRNIFVWKQDVQLKFHFQKAIVRSMHYVSATSVNNAENIACQFLDIVREKPTELIKKHLTSYLQESCYWAAKQVYSQKKSTIKLLSLEECFSSGNEASIQPEKILKNYQIAGGSKITTYAQIRLKTIISDAIYRDRKWKLLTNWGLLKKIAKSKREKVLTQIAGLQGEKLQEYLLVWQCYVDNAITVGKKKHNSLAEPNASQWQLMASQYNLLASRLTANKAQIAIPEFKQRLEFCGTQARIFVNPQTTSYEEESKIGEQQIDDNLLIQSESNDYQNQVSQILTNIFHRLELNLQAIIYLYLGLDLTQQEVIKIVKLTYPNFIRQQYQFSRKVNAVKKTLLDNFLKQTQTNKLSIEPKSLLPLIQQWLEEHIEIEILALCTQCYQNLDQQEQVVLQNNYYQQSLDNHLISQQLVTSLQQAIADKLKLKIPDDANIQQSLALWVEKFCHQYFNQVNQSKIDNRQ